MNNSFNSAHKIFIRNNWNKPILKFLTKKINDKLIYLGLPSPEAQDVLEWIEHIKYVIAFQCRDYGKESDKEQERNGIEALNLLLQQLERKKQIENYVVFDGYLEEVILRGFDNSPTRINFELNNFISLYNLDFCNDITSPIEYTDINGDVQIAYKFNAINKLLQIQQSLSNVSNKFVMFLTVHSSYDGEELQQFINHPPSDEIGGYINKYNKLSKIEKNARIVRLFFVFCIQQYFATFGFAPKILPSVCYNGLGDTPLLHFTVFGIATNNTVGVTSSFQGMTEILNQKFVSIEESEFINSSYKLDGEIDVEVNPVTYFSRSLTFKRMWCNNTSKIK